MLGHGSDGAVWQTSRDTALKILEKAKNFQNELECYRRFQAANIRHIGQFAVPFLEGYDESLFAIEMTIVDAPYLLDFGKVYLDLPPPYYDDTQLMKDALAEWRERFGKDWRLVAAAIDVLKTDFGIYYIDPRPSNICTGRETDDDDKDWQRDSPPEDFQDA